MGSSALCRFLAAEATKRRVSESEEFRQTYDQVLRKSIAHKVEPIVLNEPFVSTQNIYDLMKTSPTDYLYLQYASSIQVEQLGSNTSTGQTYGMQVVNSEGAESHWKEVAKDQTVSKAREGGEQVDAAMVSLFNHVQAAWGIAAVFDCLVEALRYEMSAVSEENQMGKLRTPYFHCIELDKMPGGPTLVKTQTSRVEKAADGGLAMVRETLEDRRAMPGYPAFAISNGDDGLAGRHRQNFPGISMPFGILSWVLTCALLHCEDAGTGAYNLMLSGKAKIWYTVPAASYKRFLEYLRDTIPHGVGLSYIKRLLPRIPEKVMRELGIVRIVQEPLQAVTTLPGLVFHFTISTGTSLAEATNFYIDIPGKQYGDIWREWNLYASRCARDLDTLPSDERGDDMRQVANTRHDIARAIGDWMGEGEATETMAKMSKQMRQKYGKFYDDFTATLNSLGRERMASVVQAFTRHTVTAYDVECYVIFTRTLNGLHHDLDNMKCAKLYKGYRIDSRENPKSVAQIYRMGTKKSGSCSGALIPITSIAHRGLEPMLTRQEFIDAPAPRKWGRDDENAVLEETASQLITDGGDHEQGHHRSDAPSGEGTGEDARMHGEAVEGEGDVARPTEDNEQPGSSALCASGSGTGGRGGGKRRADDVPADGDAAGDRKRHRLDGHATPSTGHQAFGSLIHAAKEKIANSFARIERHLSDHTVPKTHYEALQQELSEVRRKYKQAEQGHSGLLTELDQLQHEHSTLLERCKHLEEDNARYKQEAFDAAQLLLRLAGSSSPPTV